MLLIGRNTKDLNETANRCRKMGGVVHTLELDLLSVSNKDLNLSADIPDKDADHIIGLKFGKSEIVLPDDFRTSVLINNAGAYSEKDLFQAATDDYYELFRSNVITAVSATDLFLPHILKNSPGLIINICSVASLQGIERSPAYSVAKHGLLGYTRSLRKTLAGKNVAVTAINLGPADSGSWDNGGYQVSSLIDPVDVARIAGSLMELSESAVVEEILVMPSSG